MRSDEFDGDALDTNRWTVIRPDNTRPPTVVGGNLNLPIDNGSIYGPGTSARNIIVQPLPDGDVEVTAKITTEPLTENYQQAGLRVYAGRRQLGVGAHDPRRAATVTSSSSTRTTATRATRRPTSSAASRRTRRSTTGCGSSSDGRR